MGSHLSHDRAKELGMMEVPDMATVPWKPACIAQNRSTLRWKVWKVNEKSYQLDIFGMVSVCLPFVGFVRPALKNCMTAQVVREFLEDFGEKTVVSNKRQRLA